MLFTDTWLDGERVDLRVRDGRIASIAESFSLAPQGDEPVLRGGLVCPPSAEPHVHLDAALLGRRVPNRTGTLAEGIHNWARVRDALGAQDVRERALETLRWYAGWGTLSVRTHVDTENPAAVEALLALRDEVRQGLPGLTTASGAPVPVTLQVVAFPQEGILTAPGRRERWAAAVARGCDAVGAIPHQERTADEGWRSVRLAFDLAEERGLMVDLHCDETDDPGSRNLEVACAEAIDRGMGARVLAGHCTALHSYPDPYAAKVVRLAAEAGLLVVTNPLDNIVLQGRYDGYPRRRGLTRVDELWAAGVELGVGHDSVMDPWYRLGTANLLDAAWMLVHAAQLTGEDQMERVVQALVEANHRPFGGPPALGEGAAATLVWYTAPDPVELLRLRPRPRVFVGGDEVFAGKG